MSDSEPSLVGRDALAGMRVGLSVSESADLDTLGLTEKHCRLVVAELVRGIFIAGGTVVYGGRLDSAGYTSILLDEIQRFKEGTASVEVVLAEPEFRELGVETLDRAAQRLGSFGKIRLVLADGSEVPLDRADEPDAGAAVADSYSAMREYVARSTVARVVVGGRLEGYAGHEPGVIEEARMSREAGVPVYVAGGYGGAAALLVRSRGGANWAPVGYPKYVETDEVSAAVERFRVADAQLLNDGLTDSDRAVLEGSHRPADIAAVVIRALSALASS